MTRSKSILLKYICLLLLITACFRPIAGAADQAPGNMEELICLLEQEEIKNVPVEAALMEEYALPANAGPLLTSAATPQFFIQRSTALYWQHAEAPLLPPELFSHCI